MNNNNNIFALSHEDDPTPVQLEGGTWFLPFTSSTHEVKGEGEGLGWYYTSYNPETREGQGWFGFADEPSYYFETELVPEYLVDELFPESERLVLAGRTCGIGEGCFWTDWR